MDIFTDPEFLGACLVPAIFLSPIAVGRLWRRLRYGV